MILQSDRGRDLERSAREDLPTPEARRVAVTADVCQRKLTEFQA
jgi:hypothetical protein